MFINATGYYVPQQRIYNDYFERLGIGITNDWIVQRTGIISRSKTGDDENINTMGLMAVRNALPQLPYAIKEVDLIITSTYSPYDMVADPAHLVQREYSIENTRCIMVSAGCTSFVNSLEVVESYFASGKAHKALIVGGDNNTALSDESDPKTCPLWGDASVAYFLSAERVTENDYEIIDIFNQSLATLGKGPDGIRLCISGNRLIKMPEGKDVFVQACTYMPKFVAFLLERHGLQLDDLSYFIGHQANLRILNHIAKAYKFPKEKILSNIEELGNTGSSSCALVFAQNIDKFKRNNLVSISVFGGGYSAGACLIRI